MKHSVGFLMIFLFFEIVVGGQERVFTLPQLIDSALAYRVDYGKDSFTDQHNLSVQLWRPVEISYRKGYLYSLEVEQEWRVRQEFESPVRWFDKDRIKKYALGWSVADSLLRLKQSVAALKKSYFLCVYRYAQYSHYRRVLDMVDRWLNAIPADSMEGEIDRVYAEWWLKLQDSYYDWLEAQNELRYRAGLAVLPIPADTVPELYQIEPVPDTSTRTPARLFFNAYVAQHRYETAHMLWLKHGQWPSLFFDVSLRSGSSHQNRMAWQVGVRIPMATWLNSKHSVNPGRRRNIAEYEWQKRKAAIDFQSEKLIILMNKRFAQVMHYRNRVLPQMERETYRIVNQMLDDKAMLRECISKFLLWQVYYNDYLNAIYEYNCLAAELEVLAY